MDTTAKKPRAKTINAQWAALKAAGMECVGDSGAYWNSRRKWHYVRFLPLIDCIGTEVGRDGLESEILACDKLLMHARKGSGWANALDQAIFDCPKAQAVIAAADARAEARKEAAKLAKAIGKAKPAARAQARL